MEPSVEDPGQPDAQRMSRRPTSLQISPLHSCGSCPLHVPVSCSWRYPVRRSCRPYLFPWQDRHTWRISQLKVPGRGPTHETRVELSNSVGSSDSGWPGLALSPRLLSPLHDPAGGEGEPALSKSGLGKSGLAGAAHGWVAPHSSHILRFPST